jgi:hypothetical protein
MQDCFKILNDYSGRSKYKYINQFLLMDENDTAFKKRFKKDLNEIKEDIKQIDECFKKSPITKDDSAIVYRGMERDMGLKIGESTVLKNFVSTSFSKDIAQDFMKREYSEKSFQLKKLCCLYKLHVAKDIPYINMTPYSKFGKNEREVLLPRGLIMTYIGDEEDTHVLGKFTFKYNIKIIKITKLNEDIKPNIMADMGEPITDEFKIAEEKRVIEEKKVLDKKERCPKGTRKNKQGICESTMKEKTPIIQPPSIKIPSPQKAIESPSIKFQSPVILSKNKNKKERCPKGTRKNKQGICESTMKEKTPIIQPPSIKIPSPQKAIKSLSIKFQSPVILSKNKKERCPKGTRKNKQGECIKSN